jgi:hypothetical protein
VSNWLGLIEFSSADLIIVVIAIQQYFSISRDIKRTKEKAAQEEAARAKPPTEPPVS